MERATTQGFHKAATSAWVLPPLAEPTAADDANHRVANSLQMIAALLAIEAHDVTDAKAAAALSRAQQRIEAIGAVHRHLYAGSAVNRIDLGDYLRTLGNQIGRSVPDHRRITVTAAAVPVDAAAASSLGMLMVELVTNACKYAYAARAPGHIAVSLRHLGQQDYRFMVEDHGIGSRDVRRVAGLGSRLIAALEARFGATAIWEDAAPGTRFYIDVRL